MTKSRARCWPQCRRSRRRVLSRMNSAFARRFRREQDCGRSGFRTGQMLVFLSASVLACTFLSGCASSQTATIPSADQFDGQAVVVNVCGAFQWNSTGVVAHRGERWFIEVTGSSAVCEDGNHKNPDTRDCDRPDCALWRDGPITASPEGWEKWFLRPLGFLKRVPSAHWYELSGGIGRSLCQTFAIGRSRTVRADEEGEIYLFANDAPSRYCNNSGSLRVRLVRLK
jgi:hypothetical protein